MSQGLDDIAEKSTRGGQVQKALEELIRSLPRGTHVTAPEVLDMAVEKGLKVSLSTVYRTLNHLAAHGHISSLAGEHGKRYESKDPGHDHDHLICLKCGYTVEFADDLIRGFGLSVAERKGYEHRSSRFDILGLCPDCQELSGDHKNQMAMNQLELSINNLQEMLADLETASDLIEGRKQGRARELVINSLQIIKRLQTDLSELLPQLE